jgi:chromosome segregation ATPase
VSITDKDFTELSVKVEKIGSKADSNGHRIDDLESDVKEVKDIQITLVKLANGVENMGNQLIDVKAQIKDVKLGQDALSKNQSIMSEEINEVKNRPANEAKAFLDTVTGKIISVIAAGLIFYILGAMFPMIPWR